MYFWSTNVDMVCTTATPVLIQQFSLPPFITMPLCRIDCTYQNVCTEQCRALHYMVIHYWSDTDFYFMAGHLCPIFGRFFSSCALFSSLCCFFLPNSMCISLFSSHSIYFLSCCCWGWPVLRPGTMKKDYLFIALRCCYCCCCLLLPDYNPSVNWI